MLKRLRQLSELSLSEWQTLLIALFLLPMIAVALQIKGFRGTQSFLGRHSPKTIQSTVAQPLQLKKAKNIAIMVTVAANHGPYRANCLKKSLVTWWLLARAGIHSELKIGVNKEKGEFNAHAWVEFHGLVLNDTRNVDELFSVFDPK